MKQDMIVILDLGSEENPRLAREIRALGVYSEIYPHDLTAAQLAAMPKGSVLGSRENSYGAEVLMLRSDIPAGMVPERITIEDIMLYMARKER